MNSLYASVYLDLKKKMGHWIPRYKIPPSTGSNLQTSYSRVGVWLTRVLLQFSVKRFDTISIFMQLA